MKQNRVVETEIRVRYAETDAMGVVYHANYLIWFEVGRGDFFAPWARTIGSGNIRAFCYLCLKPSHDTMPRRAIAIWSP